MEWEPAERVQKSDSGEYRAMIGGEWMPVAKAQKSSTGEYRVMRGEVGAGDTAPVKIGMDAFPDTLRETLQNTDWGTRNIAGAGTALTNLYEGGKQLVKGSELFNLLTNSRMAKPSDGAGLSQQSQADRIIADEAPVGAIAGNIATAVPMMAAGNAPAAVGAASSIYGALQPAENASQRALNTGISGLIGAGGQVVANKATSFVGDKIAQAALKNKTDEPIKATIKEALDAGYVIPPGQVNPSFVNRQLESAGGKTATQQMASSKNQAVTDSLARKAANLADDAPITPDTLKAARDVIKKPYKDIAALGMQPKLDALDAARAESRAAWNEYSRQGTRAALNDYKQFSTTAKTIEKEIENDLFRANKPDLMRQFRDARVSLAKNHDVETALIEGGGTVDARTIAGMFQRGDKMTGELKTIGSFANNFGKDIQPSKTMGTPDAHNLKFILSLLFGGGGMAGLGPLGIAVGAIPLMAGPAARSAMFSKMIQQGLLNPAAVSPSVRMGGGLLRYAPVGGTVAGLNALNQ